MDGNLRSCGCSLRSAKDVMPLPLALLHHVSGAVAGPDPHEQVDMVRLNRQRQDRPATLSTLALDEFLRACRHWPHQHRLAALGAPEEVVDTQVNPMFVSLLCHVEIRAYDNSKINTYLPGASGGNRESSPPHYRG